MSTIDIRELGELFIHENRLWLANRSWRKEGSTIKALNIKGKGARSGL